MTIDREKTLRLALDQAQAAVKEKPSRENLANYQAAADALEKFLNGQRADQPVAGLKTEAAAVGYLTEQGYKIGKTKFNADVNRKMVTKRGGCFDPADLDDYALAAELPLLDVEADHSQVNVKDELKSEQRRNLKFKNDLAEGLYTLTADIEHMLASRAATLKGGNEQFWRDNAAEILRRAGEGMTAAELIEFGLELTEEHFDQYAQEVEL
ncbi:MAG: hypothetical protein J7K75_08565 [Desulfuromonas sp.]|nr:hypothetical protein [Desulfuromonas sp.]